MDWFQARLISRASRAEEHADGISSGQKRPPESTGPRWRSPRKQKPYLSGSCFRFNLTNKTSALKRGVDFYQQGGMNNGKRGRDSPSLLWGFNSLIRSLSFRWWIFFFWSLYRATHEWFIITSWYYNINGSDLHRVNTLAFWLIIFSRVDDLSTRMTIFQTNDKRKHPNNKRFHVVLIEKKNKKVSHFANCNVTGPNRFALGRT